MRRMKHVFLFSATLLVCIGLIQLVGCSSGGGGGGTNIGASNPTTSSLLWSVGKLQAEMNANPDLVVLDCRKDIADSTGKIITPYYDLDHIPGSIYIDFFEFGDPYPWSSGKSDATIQQYLSDLGLTVDTTICLYDTAIANPQGKVFFQLERQGCTDVHILDGGLPAWVKAGGATDTKIITPTKSNFVPNIDNSILADLGEMKKFWDEVKAGTGSQYAMIDYREDPLYWGHKCCPDAARTGHMENVKLLNWKNYFDSTTGLLYPQATLDQLTQAAGGGKNKINVLICNKGWRTGIAYFVLRYVGYPKSSLKHYVGGFREWAGEDPNIYPTITEACYRPGKNMPGVKTTAKRFAGASAQIGDQTYCIGGYQVSTATPPVVVCDINQAFDMDELDKTKQWKDLKAMPEARAFSVGAAVDGKVYVFGGLDTAGSPSLKGFEYDPALDQWSNAPDMPAAHFSFAAVAVETYKEIYTFGGLTGDGTVPANYSDKMYCYDVLSKVWNEVPKVSGNWPEGRRCHAMVAINDTLYLIGGYYYDGSKNDLDDIWTFDRTDWTAGWTKKAVILPKKAAGHSAAVVNGKIYIPGWWSLSSIKYDVMEYDPATDDTCLCERYTRAAQIGWPRYWYFIGACNNEFVTIGGFGGGPGNIATTDHSGFTHFHQPYVYDVTLTD